jgi:DNA modification methylase
MLSNSVRPGGLVYEPFGGSGSTLIACHTLGMVARVVELDRRYCDVICRRYQEHTGVVPVRGGVEVDFTASAA